MTSESRQPADSSDDATIFWGPANWFSLQIPTGIRIEQTEAVLEMIPVAASAENNQPPEHPWSMTLYAAWVEDPAAEPSAASFSPTSLFPGVVQCNPCEPLPIPAPNRGWAGMSLKSTGPWWRRLFQRRNSYQWRLWVIEHRQIIVVASLQTTLSRSLPPEASDVCMDILRTISFSEHLALPPDLFRKEVVQLAKKHFPLLDISPTGTFGIRISESEIHLTNFYRSYLKSPDQLKQIVLPGLTTVVRLQEWGPEQLMPPLPEVSDRIMPMLYPEEEADDGLAEFVRISWVAGLSVMFVLDEDDTYRFVHSAMLEDWGLTVDELHQLAMNNLEQFATDNPLEVSLVGEDDDPRMLIPVNPDAYNSVRLLGQQLHFRLRQMLGAELVVGIPNRDFFVAVSLNHPKLIGEIRQQVMKDFQSMHHPLTCRLLVISADGVSEYCEE